MNLRRLKSKTGVCLDTCPKVCWARISPRTHFRLDEVGNYQNWNYNQQKIWVDPNLIQRGHEYDIKAQINFDTDQDGYANRTVS